MSRYRSDYSEPQDGGEVAWYARWMGGPTLSKVEHCRTNLCGDFHVTAHVTGEPDTFFSIPAYASIRGVKVLGYLTRDDFGWQFRHVYY